MPLVHNGRVVGSQRRIKREKVAQWPRRPFKYVTKYTVTNVLSWFSEKKYRGSLLFLLR